jgi:hypothetical protein
LKTEHSQPNKEGDNEWKSINASVAMFTTRPKVIRKGKSLPEHLLMTFPMTGSARSAASTKAILQKSDPTGSNDLAENAAQAGKKPLGLFFSK